jgi:hypothetical protein
VRPRARVRLAVPCAVESLTADFHQRVLNHNIISIIVYFLVASVATEHKNKRTIFVL